MSRGLPGRWKLIFIDGINERMGEVETGAANPTPVPFICRPRSLRDYFRLRYQGVLPSPRGLNFLEGFISPASAILETLILAGMPPVLVMFVTSVVPGVKVDLFWGRVICCGILALSVPFACWWFWISPRSDILTISGDGFRWRISLARGEWFRCQGSIALADLRGFLYRSDWTEPTPVEPGPAINQKLARLWLELNVSRHDLLLYLKNDKTVVIRNVFARFDQSDVQRFIEHLAAVAEPCQISVRT